MSLSSIARAASAGLRVVTLDFDVRGYIEAETAAELPAAPDETPSHMVVFRGVGDDRNPMLVDRDTAGILELSDGTRTVQVIAEALGGDRPDGREAASRWIEHLFGLGFLCLRKPAMSARAAGASD